MTTASTFTASKAIRFMVHCTFTTLLLLATFHVILGEGHQDNSYKHYQSQDYDNNVTEHWVDMRIDHYNFQPTNPATFRLRYFVHDDHYHSNCASTKNNIHPLIFYAGNEAPIEQFVRNSGFLFEAARELHALLVFAEHRYYGKSVPFGKVHGYSPHNISYLTVEQAMADYNQLQNHLRTQYNMAPSAAFIVTGGSYGANLALWMRLKYPHLWAGALASSATPVKHALRDTNAFNRIVNDVYANVSEICPVLVRQGWSDLFAKIQSPKGRDEIQQVLGLCHMPHLQRNTTTNHQNNDLQLAYRIYNWIDGALETMVQYGYPYPTNFYNPVPGYPFRVACEKMQSANTGLGALRAAANVYYNTTGQAGNCFPVLDEREEEDDGRATMSSRRPPYNSHWLRMGQMDRLAVLRVQPQSKADSTIHDNDNDDDDMTGVAWGYQCCTEVYQPMPTNGITDMELPYTPNQTQYFADCQQQWAGVTPRPNWEEWTLGGNRIFSAGVGNIFLTSGQFDPWRAAGITQLPPQYTASSIQIRIIERGAHHYDLRASHPLDIPSVRKVRQEELDAMRRWVEEWQDWNPSAAGRSTSCRIANTSAPPLELVIT